MEKAEAQEINCENRIDFRTLVYIYLCQHPESTKASIAKQLGMTPITLTRAIAAGKQGVSESLVPGIIKLMSELDFSDFSEKLSTIQKVEDQHNRAERIGHLKNIVSQRLSCSLSELTNVGFMAFCWGGKDGDKKYFGEIPNGSRKMSSQMIRPRVIRCLNMITRIPGSDEIILFYYTPAVLSLLLDETALQKYDHSHKITAVQVDLDREKVISEFVLCDPKKELPQVVF